MRILVVEDEDAIARPLAEGLRREGFEVDSARDGGEAIEQMLQHDYDIITLDLMMPRVDGFAVVRYLTKYWPEKLANVVVMTAYGTSALEKVCSPVSCAIEKPFDIDKLLAEATEPPIDL